MKNIYKVLIIILTVYLFTINCNAAELNCDVKMKYGDQSENIKRLQSALNATERCGLPITGYFGDMTLSCVKKYQSNHGLSPSGIVGKKTCKKLKKISVNGSIITYKKTANQRGIVTGDIVNIRRGPTTSSGVIKKVKRGNIYTIKGDTTNWYIIDYKGQEGYINKKFFVKKFVLVDISMQRLYYFNDGYKKWSTNVVTGNKGNHDTPVGTYTLNRNYFGYHTYLEGNNDDGSRYKAYVDYWMPFILSSGIGFHDASWRPESDYNKNEFNGNGSHGCVNMQTDAAKKLYNSKFNSITVIVRK